MVSKATINHIKSNTCPPKRSQKPSLRKLVPIPLLVSGVGNSDITVGSLPRTQPDVSLSRLKCARKGRREGVCTLPMVPCGSTPVTRVLRSPLRREQRSAWGGGWLGALFKGQRQWHKSKRRFSDKLHGTYRVNKRTIWYQYLELYLHQWVSTSKIQTSAIYTNFISSVCTRLNWQAIKRFLKEMKDDEIKLYIYM